MVREILHFFKSKSKLPWWCKVRLAIPGITARAFSASVEDLVGAWLAERLVDPDAFPPAVAYRRTDRGHRLRRALLPLIDWAETRT